MSKVFVEVVNYETGAVEKRLGPLTAHAADKVDRGVNINLNHEKFYTRIIEERVASHAQRQA